MAEQNWWEADAPVSTPPAPSTIFGREKPGQDVDLATDRVKLDRERAARVKDAADLERARIQAQREKIALGSDERKAAATGGVDTTEAEKTAGFLATRLAGGLAKLGELGTSGNPTIGTQMANALPMGLGNYLTGDARQRTRDAQLDLVDAALTLGTGAAYTPEQIEAYRQSYFPQIGDTQNNIKDKQQRLQTLLQAARLKAGAAAPQIDEALKASGLLNEAHSVSEEGVNAFRDGDGKEGLAVDITDDQDPNETDEQYKARIARGELSPSEKALDAQRNTITGKFDAAIRGATDTVTLGFADELAGGIDTLSGGTLAGNIERERAIDRADERVNGNFRLGGQIGGGFILPAGKVTSTRGIVGLGAGYGGAYGFGSTDGGLSDRLIGAAKGSAVGAAGGAVLGTFANKVLGGGSPGGGGGASADLMAAADRQGINVLPADVGGGISKRFTAGVAQSPFGGGHVQAADQAIDSGVAGRLAAIAQGEGAPLKREVFGDTVKEAAEGYIARTGDAGKEGYAAARRLAPDAQIKGSGALENIDNQIAELAPTSNTDASLIKGLQTLRADLADEAGAKPLSIDAMRRLRTSTRAEAQTEGLRGTDYSRRAGLVLDDLSKDITSQLPPEAAAAFAKQDKAWAERLDFIDHTLSEVIGPKGERSAEKVADRLRQMSRSDSSNLRQFVNTLKPEEAGIVRGSLIQDLGTNGKERFSLDNFLGNWDAIPDRTKALLFKGESKAAIDDLVTISRGVSARRTLGNTSKTTGTTNSSDMIRMVSTIGAWSSFGATALVENLTGRLLASPRFARILANPVPKSEIAKKLGRLAAREPALAPDIQPILRQLQQSPTRAAAQGEEQDK